MNHAPAEFSLGDQQFHASCIAVASVEASGMQDGGAGVLFTEADERGESERFEPAQLAEVGEDETRIAIKLNPLAFHAGGQLQVVGVAAAFKLRGLTVGDGIVGACFGEHIQRKVHAGGGRSGRSELGDGRSREGREGFFGGNDGCL